MRSVVRRRLGTSVDALGAVVRDRDLGRLSLAWLAVNAGTSAFLITNLVVAYEAGGTLAIGLLGLARSLVPTLLSPLAGSATARWRPERVLLAVAVARAFAAALAVLNVALDGPLPALYAIVVLEAAAGAFYRPLHMAMLPAIARTPGELVASNVSASAAEGLGTFLGPAVAGLLLAVTGSAGAHLAVLAIFGVAVAALTSVDVPVLRSERRSDSIRTRMTIGMRTLAELSGPRLLIVGLGAQTLVRGLLTVLTVVAGVELLGLGEPGVGLLGAAMGAGGIIGALGALGLAGRARLSPAYALALAAWGAPIAVIGLIVHPVVGVAMMVVVGTSNAILDIATYTLLQRTTPNRSRAAVLGFVDSVAGAGGALGGILAPVLVAFAGVRGGLIVTGAILPIVSVLLWPRMRHVDAVSVVPTARLERIRSIPLFAPLSLSVIEELAGQMVPIRFAADTWLMREGDEGDRYYLIDSGEIEVSQGGVVIGIERPGSGVGEIALIRRVPRTASVRALTDVSASVLSREDFIAAVTGHPASRLAAETIVTDRLATTSAGPGSG